MAATTKRAPCSWPSRSASFCRPSSSRKDVAGKFVERAGDRFAHGDSAAGWRDLATADRLGGEAEAIAQLRHQYADERDQRSAALSGGRPGRSGIARLEKLERHGLADERVRACRQIAQLMQEADQSSARGHFAEASAAIARADGPGHSYAAGKDTMDEIMRRLNDESDRLATRRIGMPAAVGRDARSA